MATSFLLTKLHHPQLRPNLVPRPLLVNQLIEGLQQGRGMTLVAAPAGFGKTTLITEWLEGLDWPFAWLCLDEGDNDPVRFLRLIVAALQTVDQRLGSSVQDVLQARQMAMTSSGELPESDEQWIQAAITALINEQISLDVSAILILDDYHVINHQSVHDIIQYLVEHHPTLLHLVLVTREDPPYPLSRMRVRSELTEIRARDLRFEENEAASFLNRTMGLNLTAEAVSVLYDRTEGWIAGLQMAALSLQGLKDAQIADWIETFSGTHHHVIDFFAEEVLRRQPLELQQFMCQTSILDSMNAALCDAISDREDSQDLLDQLARSNLFVIAMDDQRGWFRYHHLFRDFLRTQLGADEQAELHRRASLLFEEQHLFELAVQHTLASGDLEEAERVIGLACRQAMEQGHLGLMVGWLDALPGQCIQHNSELATYKGWALCLRGQRGLAERFADWAEESITADFPSTRVGELLALKAYLAVWRGDNENALALAQEVLSKMDMADPQFQTFFFNVALLCLGHAQRELGDTQAAINTYHQAVFEASIHGDHLSTMGALGELSILLYHHGRKQEAVALCRQAINRCQGSNGDPLPMTGLAYLVLAILDFEADDLESAFNHVRRGLELCEPLMIPAITLRGKLLLARLQQAVGHYQMAIDTIRVARQVSGRIESLRFVREMEATAADIYLLQGEVEPAARWAEATGLFSDDEINAGREMEYLVFARLLLTQERWEEAERLLERLARAAEERGRYGSLINILVLQAEARFAQEDTTKARDFLEQALNLASPRGYYRAFLETRSDIYSLLPELRSEAPEMVENLLGKISGRVSSSADLVFPLIDPLSAREMEVLLLVTQGLSNKEIAELLVISEWTVKRHIYNVYGKLGVKNRAQAIARAREMALVS